MIIKKSKENLVGEISGNIMKGVEELKKMAKEAKAKYDKADEKTKKKVMAGVAGAAILLASAIGFKVIKKKMKK